MSTSGDTFMSNSKEKRTDEYTIRPIARIESPYREKFGIPRQSGLVPSLQSRIIFEAEFRNADGLRGLEGFSHLWLIWGFSENRIDMTEEPVKWSPTVRPPKLGGEVRKGVWATRSPYRPNSLGLSSVRIEAIEKGGADGPVITVSGADLMDGTPIYDIKPYVPYSDSHPDASPGFTGAPGAFDRLEVVFPKELLALVDEDKRAGLIELLSLDPRAAYEKQPGYTYGLSFADYDVKFFVEDGILTVTSLDL